MANATATKGRGSKVKGQRNGKRKPTKVKGNGQPNSTVGLQVLCRVVITPLGSRALGTAVTLYKGGTVGPYCTRVNVKSGTVVSWQGYKSLKAAQAGLNGIVAALLKAL